MPLGAAHAAGQIILAADINAIETAVNGKVDTTTANATFAPLAQGRDPLYRWHDTLAATPASAKVAIVGDSTSLRANTGIHDYLFDKWARQGMPLYGVTAANILGGGNNGQTLAGWFGTRGGAAVSTGGVNGGDIFNYPATVAAAPDLLVLSFGLNDVRGGLTTEAAFEALLRTVVAALQTDLPNTDILLRMPNSMIGTGGAYLTPSTTAAAQTYSTLLRTAYLALDRDYPHVAVADTQANVYGTQSFDTSLLMTDQLHPSDATTMVDYLVRSFIAPPSTRMLHAGPNGTELGPTPTHNSTRFARFGYIQNAGNGYFDIVRRFLNQELAGTWAVSRDDTMYVEGRSAPIPCSVGQPIDQQSISVLRFYAAGDNSALAGKTCIIYGDHAGEGAQGGRIIVNVDPPSIPANSVGTLAVTVPGARDGYHGVIVQPTVAQTGLVWTARVSADNTVTISWVNPTGSAIDLPSNNWFFWLTR